MKTIKTDLLIISVLATITLLLCLYTTGKSPLDVQLYSTYYVIPQYQVIVFSAAMFSFIIFLVRATIKRFNVRSTNLLSIISFLMASYVVFRAIRLFQL